ncbi:MAG: nitroreductase family protein [Propionibacteriaceae bacterium]|jgi:nitroreductase|nr:nitroreductase family protein [Propionibacteriaceae bacterium]
MDTISQLLARKSVRRFLQKPVPEDVKQTLLECAAAAPTAGNQQLYAVVDVTDPAIKAELADICDHQGFIADAPIVLVFLADCRRWLDAYALAGCAPRDPGLGDYYIAFCDALIAAQNVVVAAHALGLGSCYIGDIVENRERLVDLLGLDEFTVPATLLVLGYPTAQQLRRRKPARFPLAAVVHTDRYRRLTPDEQKAAFAAKGEAFDTFVPPFCRRKYESAFMAEMTRSMRAYLAPFRG